MPIFATLDRRGRGGVFLAVSWDKILNVLVLPSIMARIVDLFNTQALQKTKCALES